MSDANSGAGLEGWFAKEPAAGQQPESGPDAQPTQRIAPVPASAAEPAPTQALPQQAQAPAQQPYPLQQPYAQPQQPQRSPFEQQPRPQQQQQQQQQFGQQQYEQPQQQFGQQQYQPPADVYTQQPFPQQQPFGAGPDFAGASDEGRDRPNPRRTKLALATGVGVAGIVGLATVLLVTQTGGSASAAHTTAATKPKPSPSGFQPTGTSAAGDAKQMADAFLTAWQTGDLTKAAAYTDDPADAQSVLGAYKSGLGLAGLKLTAQNATTTGVVTFSVSASIASTGLVTQDGTVSTASSSSAAASPAASGTGSAAASSSSATGTWAYTSQLTAYKKNGGWYVKWNPTMVAPKVSSTVHPVALAIAPGASKVTDASGDNLSDSAQPALQNIAALMKKNTKAQEGTAGLEIVLEDSSGKIVSGSANVLNKAVSTAVVKTTIDPGLETAATAAVAQLPRSGMVVIRPSTGAILAVANSSGSGDIALTGTYAPGSSMKVITTTGLLADGLLPQGIYTKVGCPLVEDVQGVKIHNSTDSSTSLSGTEDYEPPNTPFATDFAQSCNNAFTQWWQQMAGGKLADAASGFYGLNQPWDLGLGSKGTYFSMPAHQSGSELAEELYGQGVIEANPLSMASVAATVDTGQFHQPYLVDGLTDKVTASAIPSGVKSQLYTVMREVVTSGTAVSVGFGSGVYGKTGTAEADANKDHHPNGWMIVFDPSKDLAVAAVVVDSDFGAKTAGPEVKYLLQHS